MDYLHNTVKAAIAGEIVDPTTVRASGWIHGLQARDGGLWAQVDFTDEALECIKKREYRYISAEIVRKGSEVAVVGATLTNNPAITGMAALFSAVTPPTVGVPPMDYKEMLEALGFSGTPEQVRAKLEALMKKGDKMVSMQEAISALEAGGVVIAKSALEAYEAAKSEVQALKAAAAYDKALAAYQIVPAKRDDFLALFAEGGEKSAARILMPEGTFKDLVVLSGQTGDNPNQGKPIDRKEWESWIFEAFQSGKTAAQIQAEKPAYFDAYLKSTRGA
jgi:hypothetical protein